MTGEESRLLKVGDLVCWQLDNSDRGIAAEMNWASVTIKWDNRTDQTVMHNDMGQLDRATTSVI
jgi:hypothetical protein